MNIKTTSRIGSLRITRFNHSSFDEYMYLEKNMANRLLCDVLQELRTCNETRNYAPALGLIEEIQVLANRMEASLADKYDVKSYTERRPKLKDEITELQWEKSRLEETIRKYEFKLKKLHHDYPILEKTN